jgi:HAD superfamily hydrolase (TIGR01509 family)
MPRILGVIFDYGSTLMRFEADPEEVDPLARQALVRQLLADGVPVEAASFPQQFSLALVENDRRRLRELVDIPMVDVLAGALEQAGLRDVPDPVLKRAMRCFYIEYEQHWHLFPESKTVLDTLRERNIRLGMLTNAGDAENIRSLMFRHALIEYFDPVVISSLEGRRKPDVSLFRNILDAWQMDPASAVMIGDQLGMDILGARRAGMRSIWLRTETEMPANKADRGKILADAEADSIHEIPEILRRWDEKSS